MATKNIVPRSNGEGKLGTNVKQWLEVQAQKVYAGLIDVGETLKNLMDTKAPKDNPAFTGTVSGIKASMIENVSTGTISSITVQDAITELDTKKATKSNTLSGYGITDGVTSSALTTTLAGYAPAGRGLGEPHPPIADDIDSIPDIRFFQVAGGNTKNPFGNTGATGVQLGESDSYRWQLLGADGGSFALMGRTKSAGIWTSWKQIATTDNPTFIHQANIINSTTAQISIAGSGNTPGVSSFDMQQDGGACYLWNRSNTPILFGTGGTQRMCIGADGNIGVGVSNPQAKLHVGGPSIFNSAGASSNVLANNELTMYADNSFLYFTWKDPSGNLRTVQFTAPAAGSTRTI